jgi:MFS transporter, ACS family, D-galactonate transporter
METPATVIPTLQPDPRQLSNLKRWGAVWLMFLAAVINFIDRGSLSVALPLIAAEMNFSPAVQGTLLSSFFWSYAAMQIPMGWAVDRFDAKWVYACAFALWSMACGLTGLAGTLATLAIVRMILGIGESAYFASSTKLVSQLFPPAERGFPTGLFECGTSFGLAIGTVLTAYLSEKFGWRTMFAIIGFSGLVWLIPWIRFVPPRRQTPFGMISAPNLAVGASERWITVNRNLVGVCIGFFCYNYRWYLLMTWLPTYLVKERGMTLLGAGIMAALPYWVYASMQPLGGRLGDVLIRRGLDASKVRKGLVVCGCVCGLLILPVPLMPSVPLVFALLMVSSLTGLAVANMMVIQQACAPPTEVGRWAGVMNCSGNLAGVAAPFVTGLLVGRTGSYMVPFALGGLIMIPGILAYLFVVDKVAPPKVVPVATSSPGEVPA